MRWELGVKEVWEVPKPLDRVIHTLGWPLRWGASYKEAGGSFIYPMGEDKVCIGLVVGLDYTDATFSVHDALQLFKTHPFIKKIIEGGKRVAWGAKTIPSGGYWSHAEALLGARHGGRRRRGRHGQHRRTRRASTTRCTPACTRRKRSSRR